MHDRRALAEEIGRVGEEAHRAQRHEVRRALGEFRSVFRHRLRSLDQCVQPPVCHTGARPRYPAIRERRRKPSPKPSRCPPSTVITLPVMKLPASDASSSSGPSAPARFIGVRFAITGPLAFNIGSAPRSAHGTMLSAAPQRRSGSYDCCHGHAREPGSSRQDRHQGKSKCGEKTEGNGQNGSLTEVGPSRQRNGGKRALRSNLSVGRPTLPQW